MNIKEITRMVESFLVTVNNVPDNGTEKYVVARGEADEFWYYGSYADRKQAVEIAKFLGGVVVERID
jgi:hypothetical protein